MRGGIGRTKNCITKKLYKEGHDIFRLCPPQLRGCILFAPQTHVPYFLLCNDPFSVTGGGHNLRGGAQTEKIRRTI